MLSIFSTYYLIRDYKLDSIGADSAGPAMATVKHSTGDVKKKISTRLRWFNVDSQSKLFANDTIRTAKGASATLVFADGNTIEVGENSLLVLQMSKDKFVVNFVTGNMITHGGGQDLVVQSQGTTLHTGANGELSLSSKDGVASLKVKGGDVSLETQGKTEKIGANQQAQLDASGLGAVTTIEVNLASPKAGTVLLATAAQLAVDFSWEYVKPQKGVTLEVSTDREFKKVLKSVATAEARASATVPPGFYFWRVKSSRGVLSEVGSFEVQVKQPVRLLDPMEDYAIRFSKTAPSVVFEWLGAQSYDHYILKVAADPQFHKIIQTVDAGAALKANLTLEEPGKYFWRVEASSTHSDVRDLSPGRGIQVIKSARLEAPELVWPTAGATIPAKDGESRVAFRWAGNEEATEYLLEVSRTPDFANILLSQKATQPSYEWKTRQFGKFSWRVSVYNNIKELTQARRGVEFTVVSGAPLPLVAPADLTVYPFKEKGHEVLFKWTADPDVHHYLLELAQDPAFKKVLQTRKTDETEYPATGFEDNGTYFWRVSATDGDGNAMRVSQVWKFELKGPDLLGAPALVSPFPGITFRVSKFVDTDLEFSWSAVPGATEYEVTVRSDTGPLEERQNLVQRFDQSPAVIKKLDRASYTWSVRAIDSHGRLGKTSEARSFLVDHNALLPPEILKLEVKHRRVE